MSKKSEKNSTVEIIPAVMPVNIQDLRERLAQVAGAVPVAQIDVMDGRFVGAQSWPYQKKEDIYFEQILNEDEGLPFWQELDFEIDMMVDNPLEAAEAWIAAGAERLIIHIESPGAVAAIKDLRGRFPKDSPVILEIGVAIGIETPIEALDEVMEDIDVVQCMGIARIGFQAQPFDERVIEKVVQLRAKHPESIISVDGGVSFETAPRLIDAGVNRLVCGSVIFTAPNPRDVIRQLQNL